MPGEIVLKCAECGQVTRYRDAKFTRTGMLVGHNMTCSEQMKPYPRLYITQAQYPSEG